MVPPVNMSPQVNMSPPVNNGFPQENMSSPASQSTNWQTEGIRHGTRCVNNERPITLESCKRKMERKQKLPRKRVEKILQRLFRKKKKNRNLKQKMKELEWELQAIPKQLRETIDHLLTGVDEGKKYDLFLFDQLLNYGKRTNARWNHNTIAHSIIIQARAPGAYDFIRKSGFNHLP